MYRGKTMKQERGRMRRTSFNMVVGKALEVGEREDIDLASLIGSQRSMS